MNWFMLRSKVFSALKPLLIMFFLAALSAPAAQCAAERVSAEQEGKAAVFNPSRHFAHEESGLEPSPRLNFGRLSNGVRYVLMPNRKPEDRVSMHLFVQAGSMHEKENQRGIAHFLEHMMFNGTEHFKPGELVKYFQDIGMRFGPDVNARTGFYSTVYFLDLPGPGRESLEKGLLVLRDYAAGALLTEEEVEKERSVILSEKRTRDSVEYRTFVKTLKFEAPDALVSSRLPIGTEKVIKAADRKLLKSFYDSWYRPERMVIVMAGDFDPAAAEKLVKKRFSGLSARAEMPSYPEAGNIRHQGIKAFYHHEPEAGSTQVSIEVAYKRPKPADSSRTRKKRLLSRMAAMILNYRLEEKLNKPDAPFTSASADAGNYLNYIQSADIRAECQPQKWKDALQAVEQELRRALEYGFTQSELEQAKKELKAGLERRVKSAATRRSGRLARRIISSLNSRRVFMSPEQERSLLSPMIEEAGLKEVHQALKKDWSPDHRLVLVTGKADLESGDAAPEKQILEVFDKSREKQVNPPEEKSKVEFPYLDPPEGSARAVEREEIEDLGIVRVKFDNNVFLSIKKTDFEENQVTAALSFGRGRSSEPQSKPGLAMLAEKVVNLSGVGRLERDELRRALAGTSTSSDFIVSENSFVFRADSVSDEIPLLFQLLYTRLADPAFRRDAYKLAMKRFEQKFKSWTHSVHGAMMMKAKRFLAGGDSRFGVPGFEKFRENSLSDAASWAGRAMAEAPVEISLVGDLDVEAAVKCAAKYFGALEKRKMPGEKEDARPGPSFPEGGNLEITVPTRIKKGLVDVAYPTPDYWDIQINRRLSALSEVMSNRMRIKIREEMGAAYSYQAYNAPSRAYPGFGIYHSFVGIDPGDAETVVEAVKDIAGSLAREGVTEEERDRAVKPILTNIKERRKTNSYWLNSVLKGSWRHPEKLEWSRSILSGYRSITADDLSTAAGRYLKNSRAACITVVPESGDKESR